MSDAMEALDYIAKKYGTESCFEQFNTIRRDQQSKSDGFVMVPIDLLMRLTSLDYPYEAEAREIRTLIKAAQEG